MMRVTDRDLHRQYYLFTIRIIFNISSLSFLFTLLFPIVIWLLNRIYASTSIYVSLYILSCVTYFIHSCQNGTKASISKLVADLNDAELENDVGKIPISFYFFFSRSTHDSHQPTLALLQCQDPSWTSFISCKDNNISTVQSMAHAVQKQYS